MAGEAAVFALVLVAPVAGDADDADRAAAGCVGALAMRTIASTNSARRRMPSTLWQ